MKSNSVQKLDIHILESVNGASIEKQFHFRGTTYLGNSKFLTEDHYRYAVYYDDGSFSRYITEAEFGKIDALRVAKVWDKYINKQVTK